MERNQRTIDKTWMDETVQREVHTARTKFFLSKNIFRSATKLKREHIKKIEILYKQVLGCLNKERTT